MAKPFRGLQHIRHIPTLRTWTLDLEVIILDGRPNICLEDDVIVWIEHGAMPWQFGLCGDKGEVDVYWKPLIPNAHITRAKVDLGRLSLDGNTLSFDRREFPLDFARITAQRFCSINHLTFRAQPVLRFVVQYYGPQIPDPLENDSGTEQHTIQTLKQSFNRPNFGDSALCLYSRKRENGGIGTPLALYVNADILRSRSDYFRSLLDPDSNFNKTEDLLSSDECYPYADDSDLDDDDGVPSPADSSDANGRPYSDRAIRHVAIPDAAYKTVSSLVFYLYTGKPLFCALSSAMRPEKTKDNKEDDRNTPLDTSLAASPKSLYRLADKLGLDPLTELAFEAIKSNITVDNAVEEYFTWFSSKFERVRAYEWEFIRQNLSDPTIRERPKEKLVEEPGMGGQPYFEELLRFALRSLAGIL